MSYEVVEFEGKVTQAYDERFQLDSGDWVYFGKKFPYKGTKPQKGDTVRGEATVFTTDDFERLYVKGTVAITGSAGGGGQRFGGGGGRPPVGRGGPVNAAAPSAPRTFPARDPETEYRIAVQSSRNAAVHLITHAYPEGTDLQTLLDVLDATEDRLAAKVIRAKAPAATEPEPEEPIFA